MHFDELFAELWQCYLVARKGKRQKQSVLRFDLNASANIAEITRLLLSKEWQPGKYNAFLVQKPVFREIFAAPFVDRIVHHFLCRNIAPTLESKFIYDSYSCQVGKGTHFAITRAQKMARAVSEGFSKEAWVLRLDISGYFISIRRDRLYKQVQKDLKGYLESRSCPAVKDDVFKKQIPAFARMTNHGVILESFSSMSPKNVNVKSLASMTSESVNFKPLSYMSPSARLGGSSLSLNSSYQKLKNEILQDLLAKIIFCNPISRVHKKGTKAEWARLPKNKSLFYAKPGSGLPIGNLTSQLFGNVYLNPLDQYIKRELKIKHYGRYVDDMLFMHSEKEILKEVVTKVGGFLQGELNLKLHPQKINLQRLEHGFPFLGAYVLPYRVYASSRIKSNAWEEVNADANKEAMLSYKGCLTHFDSFRLLNHLGLGQ